MILLVDIGNTRLKWGLDEQGEVTSGTAIEHKKSEFAHTLEQQWHALSAPVTLAISSVSAKPIEHQVIAIAQRLWPDIKVVIAQTSAQAFSLSNAYTEPEKLGIDRWLNLIALQHYYPGNSAVVDCGTAITIDCINHQGQHLGGLISPGIQLMKQALYQNTAALTLNAEHYSAALSRTTESAIYSGTLYAAAGLIEKTMKELCHSQIGVLTGGDAHLLAAYLKVDCIIDVDFVLKGLSLYCQQTEKSGR